jgi:hypothetical protein
MKEIFTAQLDCEVNMDKHELEYDAWDDNLQLYIRKKALLSDPFKLLMQTHQDKNTIGGLITMTENFPFLAYTISYKFEADSESLILGKGKIFGLEVMFYPFSRPFLHRAEQLLDDALFKLLLRNAERTP